MSKVFVTGVYGSGKTRFARRYARRHKLPFISFDHLHDYSQTGNQSRRILASLPDRFVIDAIPFDENATWSDFVAYEREHDVQIVVVYCPNRQEWVRRVTAKELARRGRFARLRHELLKRLHRLRHGTTLPPPIDVDFHLRKYRSFFIGKLPELDRFRCVEYFDSMANEITSREEMLRRIRFRCFELEERLAGMGPDYDRNYQDIEVLGFVGYSESHKTWERIAGLVDWRGISVADVGCNHGYFSFKAEEAGAVVTGLDKHPHVLDTARMIAALRGSRATFAPWTAGDPTPICDLALCLNVLHHFPDRRRGLENIRCRRAIFEINADCRSDVERQFQVVQTARSHRKNRVILLCEKRPEALD